MTLPRDPRAALRPSGVLVLLLGVVLALVAVAPAQAAARSTRSAAAAARTTPAPSLRWVRCWPRSRCQRDARVVAPGGTMRLAGRNLRGGTRVLFSRRPGAKRPTAVARLVARGRLEARVPAGATTGRVRVRFGRGRASNLAGPIVIGGTRRAGPPRGGAVPSNTAFDGSGMWIWYVNRSSGGNLDAIAARARDHGVSTVFVKSADGARPWSQFTSSLVAGLKARGLRVCAWQYVYGTSPVAEAEAAASARRAGADCFVIDAEAEYEGRYAQAASYVRRLRELVGPDFPVGLSSFPYVDYHPGLPYSVFLGPGAAQFNLPQVYWKTIGTSVDTAMARTYPTNTAYGRPVMPIGQTYQGPATSELVRFRRIAAQRGATGVSWWSWQETSDPEWDAISQPLGDTGAPAAPSYALLRSGARGDLVVWAQQHLAGAGQRVAIDGSYDAQTTRAVSAYQASRGLPVTGAVDGATWPRLLDETPATPRWGTAARRASAAGGHGASGPDSARLPAVRNELAGEPSGRG